MRVLGIIPARGGSKRLPGKNMRELGGKPLVVRSIEASLGSKMLDRIAISSDWQKVLDLEKKYNDERLEFLKRPDEISNDKSPAIEYIKHAIEYFHEKGLDFDAVALIQPSSPLTTSKDIDHTINILLKTEADTAVSVVKLAHDLNPIKMKIMEGDKLLPYMEDEKGRMSDGELPEIYIRNGSVYAIRLSVIEQNRIIGDDCRGFVMERENSVDINDELDFQFAEFLIKKINSDRN